jgi:hypothetical protein
MSDDYGQPGMGTPRFVPRTYTDEPESFGRAATIIWQLKPENDINATAARLQHELAVQINRAIKTKHKSVRGYCKATGAKYQRTTDMLNGSAIMRLEDVATAMIYLDITPKLSMVTARNGDA